VFEYGVYKRRLIEGDPEDADDWTTGHPIIFPYILCNGVGDSFTYQMRIPIDDTHTLHALYAARPRKEGEALQDIVPARRTQVEYDSRGLVDAPQIVMQDEMAWIGQGPVSERTIEHLVTSDKGVILYHNLIWENIDKVERGEDPMAIVRDPAKNEPYIGFKRERESRKMARSGSVSEPNSGDRFSWAGVGN